MILVYENGEKREFDITPLLGKGLFASLKDPRIFSQARLSFDTVSWPNGLDIDPERLYEDSVPADR